jgi:hypothetical protein
MNYKNNGFLYFPLESNTIRDIQRVYTYYYNLGHLNTCERLKSLLEKVLIKSVVETEKIFKK